MEGEAGRRRLTRGGEGEGRQGDERGRGQADGVDLRKRADGADSPKAEPGRQPTPYSLNSSIDFWEVNVCTEILGRTNKVATIQVM
jgi:hypothetical protein